MYKYIITILKEYTYIYIDNDTKYIYISCHPGVLFFLLKWYFLPLEVAAPEVLSDITLQLRGDSSGNCS